MEQLTFHGPIRAQDFATALMAEFDQGDMRSQTIGEGDHLVVQIASVDRPLSGGRTALTIHLSDIEDGVHIQIGQQEWLGIAASLGRTALDLLRNPLSLVGRLDDVAQDIASLQLQDHVRESLQRTAETLGASYEISERLRRLTCEYCQTANPVGEPHCIACGAPLGLSQPIACPKCGYITEQGAAYCPQCGEKIGSSG
jgi:DNA-directed RNA polymerase subunit RPC12/RpoP